MRYTSCWFYFWFFWMSRLRRVFYFVLMLFFNPHSFVRLTTATSCPHSVEITHNGHILHNVASELDSSTHRPSGLRLWCFLWRLARSTCTSSTCWWYTVYLCTHRYEGTVLMLSTWLLLCHVPVTAVTIQHGGVMEGKRLASIWSRPREDSVTNTLLTQ